MELTLGPVLFEWKKADLLDFYERAGDMDVDRVYLGEVVCAKKLSPGLDGIEKALKTLEASGKKVTLSSLAIVSNEQELEFTRGLSAMHSSIEANDISVLNIVDASVKEVFAGPHITSYNGPSVEFLKGVGVRRVTFPVELSKASMSHIIKETGVSSEVFAHGKAPLAFSWRCYTSRHHGLSKTDCRHHCSLYPDGMDLKTMDDEPVFSVNGTSVLSSSVYTLIESVEELKEMGVEAIRISPQIKGTDVVVALFRERIAGRIGPEEGMARLAELGNKFCNGWFAGKAGKDLIAKGFA